MKTKSARSSNEADLHNMAEMRNAAEMRNLNEMRNIQEMRNNAAAAAAAANAASNMRNMSDMRNAAELRNMTASDMRNLTEMRNMSEMRQMDMRNAASDMRSAASDMRNATSDMRNMSDMRSTIGGGVSSSAPPVSSGTTTSVTWAPTIGREDQGSEIDIIMAKIEQARLSLANVCPFLLSNVKIQFVCVSIKSMSEWMVHEVTQLVKHMHPEYPDAFDANHSINIKSEKIVLVLIIHIFKLLLRLLYVFHGNIFNFNG